MKRPVACRVALAVAAFMVASGAAPRAIRAAGDAIAGSYQLQPAVIGAGGVRMQGANGWSLDGTVGQVDAIVQSGAGGLRLDGGFWRAATGANVVSDRIFANGFESPPGHATGTRSGR